MKLNTEEIERRWDFILSQYNVSHLNQKNEFEIPNKEIGTLFEFKSAILKIPTYRCYDISFYPTTIAIGYVSVLHSKYKIQYDTRFLDRFSNKLLEKVNEKENKNPAAIRIYLDKPLSDINSSELRFLPYSASFFYIEHLENGTYRITNQDYFDQFELSKIREEKQFQDYQKANKEQKSNTDLNVTWRCGICDGDSSTGCLSSDPTECHR